MSVIIPAKVSGSYINADNRVAGAQSSFNDVIIRAVLEGDWAVGEGEMKSLIATFTDARGETASTVLLLPSMLDGEDNAYLIPIPVGAKKYEGDLSLVLTEYEQEPGTDGTASFTGDGSGKQFVIDTMPVVLTGVTVGGAELAPTQWAYEYTTGTLTFAVAPASGAVIEVGYKQTVTARIRRTANCFLRVLPGDYSVVTDDELDSTVVEQLLAELYITRNARNEAVAARDGAEAARDVAVSAKNDAVAAKVAAQSAETNARQSSTQAFNYKEAALSAKNHAETAQAAAEAAKDTAVSAKNTAVSAKSDAQISATQALNYATQAFNSKEAALTAKSRAEAAQTASESAKDAAVAAKNDAVSAKDAAVSAKTAAETAQAAAEAAAIDASEKAEVILPIDYIQDEMPTNYDENEYWFAPSEGKLYSSTYTAGSGYAWNDVTDEKLKMGNIYVTGNGQLYWCPYDDLWPAKAVPVAHTHTVSQITDFTSGITRKADKVSGAVSGHFAGLDENGDLTDSGVYADEIINAARRAAEAAVVVKLALMSSESSILASSTSDYNNKLAYATDTHKIYSCYQNAWHDATASMLKEENIYTYGVPNYVYFFDGTQLKEITYFRKISGTTNNFASFSAGGGIQDSGFKGSNFAAASHTHTKSQITDLGLPTPTAEDAGKTLKVDGLGRYYLSNGGGPFSVRIEVSGMITNNLNVSYGGIEYYTDGDTITIPEGGILHCYAYMSYGDNKVFVDGDLVAEGGSPGAAEYDYVVTSDLEIVLNGVPNDHGYVDITTVPAEE